MPKKITADLIAKNIISIEESRELLTILEANPNNFLTGLFQFFFGKMSGTPYPATGGGMFSFSVSGIKKEEVNVDRLNIFLNILFSGELLEEITYKKLQSEISNYQIVNDFHLVYRAIQLNGFYKNFTKEDQLKFFKQLKGEDFKSNLVEERKEKKLSTAIEEGKLNSYFDFLKYCYNCKIFEFKPKKYNRDDLFKRLLKIYHELTYDGIIIDKCFYDVIENDEINSRSNQLINLSFQIADKTLTHHYELKEKLVSKKAHYQYDIGNFLELVNKTLTDFGFDYRFVSVTNESGSKGAMEEDDQFAICRIDKQMQSLFNLSKWHDLFLYAKPHYHFWPNLSYYQIQYAIYHYKISGVLNHLSSEQVENITANIFDSAYGSYADLLSRFPGTVAKVKRWRRIEKEPYRAFLESLNTATKNVLNFYDIEDNFPGHNTVEMETAFVVSFKIDKESYRLELIEYGDFNTQIVHFVNEIVKKNYSGYLLLDVISSGIEDNCYMFLTMEQAEYLSKYKILLTRPIF